MKNWGNWSYNNLESVIEKAKKNGESNVSIDQEHTDYQNDKQVEKWLTEMGLKFETRTESTTIFLK